MALRLNTINPSARSRPSDAAARGRPRSTSTSTDFCNVMVFSVGGQRLAARIQEIGSVRRWLPATPVPSSVALVNGVVRSGDEVLPVFDLAGSLNVTVKGNAPFCLVAKSKHGPMAVCIDEEIPTLQLVEQASMKPSRQAHSNFAGTCLIEAEEVPVYSFADA